MRRERINCMCVRVFVCVREIYIYRDLNSEVSEAENAQHRIIHLFIFT